MGRKYGYHGLPVSVPKWIQFSPIHFNDPRHLKINYALKMIEIQNTKRKLYDYNSVITAKMVS